MATKKTVIELVLVGGEKIKVDFDQIGDRSQRALRKILDSGKPVPATLRAVDAAAKDLAGSAANLSTRLGPLGAGLSAIGPAGLAAAGAAGAVGGLFALSKRAIDTASALQDTSDKLGIGVEALQEYQFAAQQSGVDQETLNQSIGIFTTRVGQAKQGVGPLVSALKDVDKELLENIRNTQSMDEALELAFTALAEEEDAAKKAALANALFGKSGRELIPIVKDGAKGIQDLRDRARELGIVLDAQTVAAAEKAGDQLDTLGKVVSVNLTRALLNFAPFIGAFSESLANAAAGIRDLLSIDVPDTTKGQIAAINAEIEKLRAQAATPSANPLSSLFLPSKEDLEAQIKELERQRGLLEKLAAKVKPTPAGKPAPIGPTVEEIEAQKKAAREFASEQEKIAKDLIKLHEDSAQAELEGIEKVQAARDQEIAKYQDALDKKLISEEQFAQAREDLEKKAQAEITKIQAEEQKKRETAQAKLAETIRDSEQEVTEAVADESEKRRVQFENETEDRLASLREQALAAGHTEAEITAILEGERQRRKTIWEHQAEDASHAASAIGEAFEDAIAGIAAGTRELDDIPDLLKDVFASAFAESIKEKLKFDELFKGNIFDLVGSVGDILTGNGGLGDIFGSAFGDALLGKGGAESGFLGKLGNLVGLVGGAGAAGGLSWGGLLGGSAGAAGSGVLLSSAGPTAAELGALAAAGGPGSGVLAAEAGTAAASGSSAGAAGLGAAGWGALFAAAAIVGDNIGKQLSESNSPFVSRFGKATDEFLIPRDAELAFQGKGIESLKETAMGLLIGGPAFRGIFSALGFDPLGSIFGEPTKGTQFRKGIGGSLRDVFPDLELLMKEFDEAEERFPELFESALPPIRAVATAIAQMAETPLKTADEVAQITNILINSLAAQGKGAADAIELSEKAMEELGITAEDAGRLAVDALEEGEITADEFRQTLEGLARIADVPFEVMKAAILATITDAEALRHALLALGEIDFSHLENVHHSSAGIQDPDARRSAAIAERNRIADARGRTDLRIPERAMGGWVPGPSGAETLIRAHGGEMVVPMHDRSALAAWAAKYGSRSDDLGGLRTDVQMLQLALSTVLERIAGNTGRMPVVAVKDRNDIPADIGLLERRNAINLGLTRPRPDSSTIFGHRPR